MGCCCVIIRDGIYCPANGEHFSDPERILRGGVAVSLDEANA